MILQPGSRRLYELARLVWEPLLPYFHGRVRQDLKRLATPGDRVLDVGGRRSPYTVGLPIAVTVVDLPRTSDLQTTLGLGVNDEVLRRLRARRSNIEKVVLEDMTQCSLPSASFDGVISVEVIEHVPDDDAFVRQIARVLKPGGWVYLTTPNGDYITNEGPTRNPDHVRHYHRSELATLLARYFDEVQVWYGIASGANRMAGMAALNPRRPIRLLKSVAANLRNRMESQGIENRAHRTAHLFASARARTPSKETQG